MKRLILVGVTIVAALAFVVPLGAQWSTMVPTKDHPLRFSAFAVAMNAGAAGEVEIAIERWTADPERQSLLNVLGGASFKSGGQDKLLSALQKVNPRTGFIRTPNSLGWDLRNPRQNVLPDGSRQIVIATDKPVSFLAAAADAQSMDYAFSFVEMRFKKGSDQGEGRLLARSAVAIKDQRIQLEDFDAEPVRLTTIKERADKK